MPKGGEGTASWRARARSIDPRRQAVIAPGSPSGGARVRHNLLH